MSRSMNIPMLFKLDAEAMSDLLNLLIKIDKPVDIVY